MTTLPLTLTRQLPRHGGFRTVVALAGLALSAVATLAQPPVSDGFAPKITAGKLADFTPLGGPDTPDGKALAELLLQAGHFSPETLAEKAVAFPAVEQLKVSGTDPASITNPDLRYKLVKFTGRLAHVARVALPPALEKAGVAHLYEAKVFLADRPDPLYLAVATLPATITVGPQPPTLPPVTAAGYFLKVARRHDADVLPGETPQFAPVVVAPTFALVTTKSRYDFDGNRAIYKGVLDFTSLRDGDRAAEVTGYNDLVRHAQQFDPKELVAAATEIPLTEYVRRKFTSVPSKIPGAPPEQRLVMEREDLRFKLLKVKGLLKRIVPIPVSDELRAVGVTNLYEMWVVQPNISEPTVCAVATELPPGLVPTPDLDPARPVVVAGFFLKVIRYPSGIIGKDGKPQAAFAPLFFCRTVVETDPPPNDGGGNWRTVFLPAILTGLGLLTVLFLGLTWWFKASDRGSRKVIEGRRQVNPFADPPRPDAIPPEPPNG